MFSLTTFINHQFTHVAFRLPGEHTALVAYTHRASIINQLPDFPGSREVDTEGELGFELFEESYLIYLINFFWSIFTKCAQLAGTVVPTPDR